MAAAAVPTQDFAVIVAAASALLWLQQRLLRLLLGDVALIHDGNKPSRRRIWIKAFQSHRCLLLFSFLAAVKQWPDATNSRRTRSSFRLRQASHKLSSSRGGTLRSVRGGASCRKNWRCAHPLLSR